MSTCENSIKSTVVSSPLGTGNRWSVRVFPKIMIPLLFSGILLGMLAPAAEARIRCNFRACEVVAGKTVALRAFDGPLRYGSKVVIMTRRWKLDNARVSLTNHYYFKGAYVGCNHKETRGKKKTKLRMWADWWATIGWDFDGDPSIRSLSPDGGIQPLDIDGVRAVVRVQINGKEKTWTDTAGSVPKDGRTTLTCFS
jgi:hypothetical protein